MTVWAKRKHRTLLGSFHTIHLLNPFFALAFSQIAFGIRPTAPLLDTAPRADTRPIIPTASSGPGSYTSTPRLFWLRTYLAYTRIRRAAKSLRERDCRQQIPALFICGFAIFEYVLNSVLGIDTQQD